MELPEVLKWTPLMKLPEESLSVFCRASSVEIQISASVEVTEVAAVERRVKWVWSCARLNAQLKEKAINRQGNVFPTHPERSGSDLSSPWCIFFRSTESESAEW